MRLRFVGAAALVLIFVGCGSDGSLGGTPPTISVAPTTTFDPTTTAGPDDGETTRDFPDVLDAVATLADDGTWRFDVTLSSPYDTPEQYADAWHVLGPDGTEYGIRVLLHDHASEQPFTRSQSGILIPDDVDVVTIEGRDLQNGWGGETLELRLER